MKKGDKFDKTDIAQILVGAFVIAESTYFGGVDVSLFFSILTFLVLLSVAITIFSIISIKRKGIILRILITVPSLLIIATILEILLTKEFNIANILIHSGIALPISAGIDALKD